MHSNNKERLGYALIIFTALLVIGALLTRGPIPQDVSYHLFVDTRTIGSIPNFWNVVTNIPFAIVGLLGLYKLRLPGRLGRGNTVALMANLPELSLETFEVHSHATHSRVFHRGHVG